MAILDPTGQYWERKAARSSCVVYLNEHKQDEVSNWSKEEEINESIDIVYVIERTVNRKSRLSRVLFKVATWLEEFSILLGSTEGSTKGPKGRRKRNEEAEEAEELANQERLMCRRGRRGNRCSKPHRGGIAGAVGSCGGFRVRANATTAGRCNDELLFVEHPHPRHHQLNQTGSAMEMTSNVRGKEETSSSNLRRSPWSIHIRKGRHFRLSNSTTQRQTLRHHRCPFLQFQWRMPPEYCLLALPMKEVRIIFTFVQFPSTHSKKSSLSHNLKSVIKSHFQSHKSPLRQRKIKIIRDEKIHIFVEHRWVFKGRQKHSGNYCTFHN